MSLDDPATTLHRRQLIQKNGFLKRIYLEWYGEILQSLPMSTGKILEVGSGPGFLGDLLPDLISSEILLVPDVSLVLDAQYLPFEDGALRAIVMTDVLHHIPQVRLFISEATRTVHRGGVIAVVEPWRTTWSQWVYQNLHHERFDPVVPQWEFDAEGPLSSANGALPWILFERDRDKFEKLFPEWTIEEIRPMMPFRYLLSGGFTFRSMQPAFTYNWWKAIEKGLGRWNTTLAMFAFIRLRRT